MINSDAMPIFFHSHKPVEVYLFTDPLCHDCRIMDPFLIKLIHEYGHYFTVRRVLTGKATGTAHRTNRLTNARFVWEKTTSLYAFSCNGKTDMHHGDTSPYMPSLAIKAAEMQGRKAGLRFLRKLQERLFLCEGTPDFNTMLACAEESGIDVAEFAEDLHADRVRKAFQCDLKFANEMQITEVPSLVFLHTNAHEDGIKVSGLYTYDIYVQVLQEIINEQLVPQTLPPMEDLIGEYEFLSTKELAIIYGLSLAQTERELKKLILKRIVRQISTERDIYWKHV
ncbi:DsbA family protein [Ectobacillus antri]|jgi:predicted DsbA family dithiol-disulfide isomerase|uniref:DsbA family protein n=1 Tax=Ectobacillus antri TaxID=2486280 RepID=A0ABT6H4T9_9BACI|nr:DsbA family protein [Ectobacillus antri]MDG4656640.1 DsbA family protein [Ectobacillus antri]MDG5753997.1 DsbA family protein [Ectobacillus antri]